MANLSKNSPAEDTQEVLDIVLKRLHRLEHDLNHGPNTPHDAFMRGLAAAIIVVGQVQNEEIIKEQLLNAKIQREGKKVRR